MFACFCIPTSTALFPHQHGLSAQARPLFSDYFSTWMAEGRDEGNNHSVSLAAYALPSHFTDLTILPKGMSFPTWYQACLCSQLRYETFECVKDGSGWERPPVGVPGVLVALASPHPTWPLFKRSYSLSDPEVEQGC